jgi:hypothetical protein
VVCFSRTPTPTLLAVPWLFPTVAFLVRSPRSPFRIRPLFSSPCRKIFSLCQYDVHLARGEGKRGSSLASGHRDSHKGQCHVWCMFWCPNGSPRAVLMSNISGRFWLRLLYGQWPEAGRFWMQVSPPRLVKDWPPPTKCPKCGSSAANSTLSAPDPLAKVNAEAPPS